MSRTVYHNSRLLRFRSPSGAMPAGQPLKIALCVGQALENASVTLRVWMDEQETLLPMQVEREEQGALFCVTFNVTKTPGLMWYYFKLELPDGTVCYYGGESGEGRCCASEPPAYQVTVYDPAFETPRWFRESVMYQIFPDRFCRAGDHTKALEYHQSLGRSPRVHEDWGELPQYLPEQGQPHYMPDDFFLGDIKGIAEKVDYLRSFGIGCVYLNPVFESRSNHRYDTADYRKVDPLLGTNEEFEALCETLKSNGMRLMLDGVFSHTGADSLYFNKYGHYPSLGAYQSEKSPYREWYRFDGGDYKSWWNFPELPEVNELSPEYMDFVMGGSNSLIDYWAKLGVSNWRLDVADELPDEFIMRMRARLKEIDPEAVLLGEVWEDASIKEAYGVRRQYVQGKALDSVMNYPFQKGVLAYFRNEWDAYSLNDMLQTLRERYPKPFYYSVMNLLSSHDVVRAITALGGAPDRDTLTREQQAQYQLRPGQLQLAKARFLAATALQMALPGVPSIYYGDEAGLTGMADPFNRGTYPWGHEDEELLENVRKLSLARSQYSALRAGFCTMAALGPDVMAVLRFTFEGRDAFDFEAPEDMALCLVNRSTLPVHLRLNKNELNEGPDGELPVDFAGNWVDVVSGRSYFCREDIFEAVLPSCSALLLIKEK
ncbi:glycoside hydrolase family 13 protein [Eubacteriales bacterium OttesenSCG-928-K08]|nr:glycoside hydrolase family 13 protein [Eubacteriales bacterium OttesenSCG-928-K08]